MRRLQKAEEKRLAQGAKVEEESEDEQGEDLEDDGNLAGAMDVSCSEEEDEKGEKGEEEAPVKEGEVVKKPQVKGLVSDADAVALIEGLKGKRIYFQLDAWDANPVTVGTALVVGRDSSVPGPPSGINDPLFDHNQDLYVRIGNFKLLNCTGKVRSDPRVPPRCFSPSMPTSTDHSLSEFQEAEEALDAGVIDPIEAGVVLSVPADEKEKGPSLELENPMEMIEHTLDPKRHLLIWYESVSEKKVGKVALRELLVGHRQRAKRAEKKLKASAGKKKKSKK